MGAGNLVNLFFERSKKVSLVRLLKLYGRSLNLLLSDYSFLRFLRLPNSVGRAVSLLFLMFSPSRLAKSQI
jgi:hypothetical protein